MGGVVVDGDAALDDGQPVAEPGAVPVLFEPGAHTGADGRVIELFIYAVKRAEPGDESGGRLFADAGDTGDVIGGIAHQRLDVDELARRDAVFFGDGFRGHRGRFAAPEVGGGQQHRDGVGHQLQAVAVAGRNEAGVAPLLAAAGEGAKDIVGLVALALDHRVAERREDFFEHRQLLGQLLRHTLAGGLVAVIHLMTEGFGPHIKGHGHSVGGMVIHQADEDIHKALNGVGMAAVVRGEQLDAVKGAVEYAVAVDTK